MNELDRPISVLHIVSAPASGGAEIFVRDLCCALSAKGHSVHIAFIGHASDLKRDEGFETKFLSNLNDHGVDYSFIGNEARRRPWLGALRLRQIIQKHNIKLIHSHLAFGNFFSIFSPSVPLIYTHHSEEIRFSRVVWRFFKIRASKFIGISATCASKLMNYARSEQNVCLIANGIDFSDIPVKNLRLSEKSTRLHAISIGRISPQKNYPFLAQAIADLGPAYFDRIKIDVFGEGDSNIIAECHKILADAGADIDLLDFRGVSSEIRKILTEYDFFLMSSAWEGLPIALLEATAAGLPSVVTKVGGCSEVVEMGPTGLVISPTDIESFSNAIRQILDNPKILNSFSQNSSRVIESYSIDRSATRHLNVYHEVLHR